MADENPDTSSNVSKSQLDVLRAIQRQLTVLNARQSELLQITKDRFDQEAGVVSDRAKAQSIPNGAPAVLAPGARRSTRPGVTATYASPADAHDARAVNQPAGKTHPDHSPPQVATPSEVSFRERLKAAKGGDGGFLQRANTFFNQAPRQPGAVGADASLPHQTIPGMSRGQVDDMLAEQIKIPRFGEWQLDDRLALARDTLGRYAARQDPNSLRGRVAGTMTGALNYAHGNAANMVAAGLLYKGLHSKGNALMTIGTDLGYSPNDPYGGGGGIIPILGDRNPLDYLTSSAGKQAAGLKWDAFKLARGGSAGVDKQQADEIYAAVAAQGYSNQRSGLFGWTTGGNAQDIANNFVAPLVAGGNGSPADIAQYLTFLKNGTTNMGSFADTLSRVSTLAKSASETTSQYNASMMQVIETLNTQFGATAGQSSKMAAAYTTATGLDPQLILNSMNDPIYKGLALGNYGVMPTSLGAMNPGMAVTNQIDEAKMLMKAYAGLGGQDQYKTMPNGQRMASVTGRDQILGAVANRMNIPVGDLRKLVDPATAGATAAGAEAVAYLGDQYHPGTFDYQAIRAGNDPTKIANMAKTWSSAVADAEKAHVTPETIRKIEAQDKNNPLAMSKALQNAIAEKSHTPNTQPMVYVKFKGVAEKFFTQDLSKIDPGLQAQIAANAGGTSLSQSAANPISPGRWLSDLTKGINDPSAIGNDAIGLAESLVKPPAHLPPFW